MKQPILLSSFLLLIIAATAQPKGNIQPAVDLPKAGVENKYVYTPPQELSLPEKVRARVLYFNKGYVVKKILMEKTGEKYVFSLKVPDSTGLLMMGVIDYYNRIYDNNDKKGYLIYLYDEKGKKIDTASYLETKMTGGGFASALLEIKKPATELLKNYEAAFKQNPALIKTADYFEYLSLLYREKKDAVRPELLKYAQEMMAISNDEQKWELANRIYGILNMPEKQKEVEEKCRRTFPKGSTAANKALDIIMDESATEENVLSAMASYKQNFGDIPQNEIESFYYRLIRICKKNNDIQGMLKYGHQLENKLYAASLFNPIAWELAGGSIEGEPINVEGAKALMETALPWIWKMRDEGFVTEDPDELIGAEIYYTDTYAMILYKMKEYDSAYYYQNSIAGKDPGVGEGNERLALYAEPSKGVLFAKEMIEPQLLKGFNSPSMVEQLKNIYVKLNLPEQTFLDIKKKNSVLVQQRLKEELMKKYGTQQAPDFRLKDINGNLVSLTSLKGKVVVLDFWATWCGPCKSSMPYMQQLVNQYKENKEVEFFFIDCFEKKEEKKMIANASKLLKDGKYDFKVLLDADDKTANDYEVMYIPARFVIDKQGKLAFTDPEEKQIPMMIETILGK